MARPRKASTGNAATHRPARTEDQPDRRAITRRQAAYLAEETGVEVEKLVSRPIAELDELLRWKIDPFLLLFRRVCGRVVRVEPGTGVVQGVPNATVHVEDTDCSFLGFFPVEGPFIWWWWFWPIHCHREEIATTRTDRCGRFCVWIPRWDIDRLLRFRLERVCFPEIVKPTLREVLSEIALERPPIPVDPNPPDPPPFELPQRRILEQAGALLGRPELERLGQFEGRRPFGAATGEMTALLDGPALLTDFQPPLTDGALERVEALETPIPVPELEVDVAKLELAPARAIGPFLRCRDVLVAEWQYFFDVPDITFRVTQDVDGDGDEEQIYSEGFFDVRWNAGTIPNVTLQASPLARSAPFCDGPVIPCGNKPDIVTVGLMPLAATHHQASTGHATRVNRPRPGGLFSDPPSSPGQAPYAGTLQLHGCHHLAGAQHYRLLYTFGSDPEVPFTGLEWYPPKLTGPPWWFHATADGQGWYEVLPEAELVFPHWLLSWPTRNFPDGQYDVRLQLADGSKTPLAAPSDVSDAERFRIDNKAPNANISQIRWRVAGGLWKPQNTYVWPFVCIVIERPTGTDIEIEVEWWASATHLRDARLSASGCGAGNPGLSTSAATREHWHESFGNNFASGTAVYDLPGTLPQGSYGFDLLAHSRAFNPARDGGGPATNWLADYPYIWTHPEVDLAVIDA